VAKAYRLLHAIFETAVDDQMVRRNPCRIEGAGKEDSPERAVVSLPAVFAIADALPVRYRAMALLATFASMRWGELVGLRRENIDLDACEIRIVETTAELDRGDLLPETPRSRGSADGDISSGARWPPKVLREARGLRGVTLWWAGLPVVRVVTAALAAELAGSEGPDVASRSRALYPRCAPLGSECGSPRT